MVDINGYNACEVCVGKTMCGSGGHGGDSNHGRAFTDAEGSECPGRETVLISYNRRFASTTVWHVCENLKRKNKNVQIAGNGPLW